MVVRWCEDAAVNKTVTVRRPCVYLTRCPTSESQGPYVGKLNAQSSSIQRHMTEPPRVPSSPAQRAPLDIRFKHAMLPTDDFKL